MDDDFEIQILYNGKEAVFIGRLVKFGYSYRIVVEIESQSIYFEPDETREHFRGLIEYEQLENSKIVDKELVKRIGEELEKMLLNP